MDCVDENQHVGVWKNSIFAKVTRISMDDDDDEDFDDQHEYAKHNQTVPGHDDRDRRSLNREPIVKPLPVPVPELDKVLDIFDDPAPPQGINTAPETLSGSMNLLDHPSLTEVTSNGNLGNGEGSLLNLDSTAYSKNDSASDFFGDDSNGCTRAGSANNSHCCAGSAQ